MTNRKKQSVPKNHSKRNEKRELKEYAFWFPISFDMKPNEKESLPALGFITVVKSRELGTMGGYLILNRNGRPVEFHCTAPVRATKSQHILFGPTLEPYIFGEQIARALTVRATISPRLILTDRAGVMALRPLIAIPMALTEIPKLRKDAKVKTESEKTLDEQAPQNNGAGQGSPVTAGSLGEAVPHIETKVSQEIEALKGIIVPQFDQNIVIPDHTIIWNGVLLHPDEHFLDDVEKAREFLQTEEIEYDLAEPFDRIREAICEAQKSAA